MTDDDVANLAVNTTDLSRLFRVTAETIRNWAREGMPMTKRTGKKGTIINEYILGDVVRWVWQRALDAGRGGDGDLQEERRRLIVEQRRSHEIDNAQKASELLSADEVATDIMAYAAIVAGQMDALPQRLAPRLVALTDPGVILGVLRDECRSVRTAASQAVAAYGDSLGSGEDSAAPAAARRRTMGRRASRVAARQPGAGAVENGSDAVLA